MTDFSHLADSSGKKETARYTFFEILGEPWLDVRLADESNKPFFNALLRRQQQSRRGFRMRQISTETLRQRRMEDARLYAKFVVVGWGNVTDKNGEDVPFTVEDCKKFLRMIPYWLFDELRDFASDPSSFLTEDEPDPANTEKN